MDNGNNPPINGRTKWFGSNYADQETTSWRTGSKWRALEASQRNKREEELLTARTHWQQAQILSSQNSRDGVPLISNPGQYDTGHTFKTTSRTANYHGGINSFLTKNGRSFTGAQELLWGTGKTRPWGIIPNVDTTWYGTKAIANTLPNSPHLDLAVSLAELKSEGLPKIGMAVFSYLRNLGTISSSFRTYRTLLGLGANEYLGYEFGLKPLISDTVALATIVARSAELVDDWVKQSGKNVHRKYVFPDQTDTVVDKTQSIWAKPILDNIIFSDKEFYHSNSTGRCAQGSRTTQTRISTRFSGAYTYLVPSGQRAVDRVRYYGSLARHLLGIRLDAEVLWNLAPWSWLSDWFSSIGDVITNASGLNSDGLALRYAYLSQWITVQETLWTPDGARLHDGRYQGAMSTVRSVTQKQRVRATPFGFGLNPDSFTNRQWAILGALGISKGASKGLM